MYENGANVPTCFLTNLEDEYIARIDLDLQQRVQKAITLSKVTATVPKYKYPPQVCTAAMLQYLARYGQSFALKRCDAYRVSLLDSQRELKKSIFGGGYLMSEKTAAEKAAAEKAGAIEWELSRREREIIAKLSGKAYDPAADEDAGQMDLFGG